MKHEAAATAPPPPQDADATPVQRGPTDDVTERQQADEALRESAQQFRLLFDQATDGMMLADAETTRITLSNRQIQRQMGYSEDEIRQLSVADLHTAADLPAMITQFERLARGEVTLVPNAPMRRKDGTVFYADISGGAVRFHQRDCLLGIFRDVTERKRADDALRTSEERFRIAADAANDVVYEWDLKQRVEWLGNIDEMLGYQPGEFPRTLAGWAASVHPEDVERTMAEVHAHLDKRTPYAAEYRVRRKDGVYRWWSARGAAARTPDGKPFRWIGSITDITERNRLELALRTSEEQFRTMANAMPQLAWIARADGFIFWYNQGWYEYTNTTPEQMEGWGWQSVHDPEVLPQVMHSWTSSIASGTPFEMQFPLRGADGRFRTFLTRVQPIRDASGQVVQWFGTNTDVEPLRQAEANLRKGEERHRLAFDATSDGIWDVDFEDGTTHFNGAYAAAFGAPAENEEPWEWWTDHVHPDDRERTLSSFNAAVNGSADVWRCEYRFRRRDRTWAHTDDRAHISRDSLGKALYIIGALSDITESKRLEAALRASAEDFRTLAEAMPQIVWATRKDGWNTYFNQQWVDYTGLTQEQSRGHGWNIPFHPDDQQRASNAWQNATNACGTYSIECRLRRADGVYRWWLIRGVPLLDKTGEVLRWFGTCTDIHDMKESEAALRASELRYRRLFESAKDGVLILDADTGMIVDVNPFLVELMGFSRESFFGKSVWDLGFFRDIIANKNSFDQLQAEEYVRYDDKPLEAKDGRRIDVEFVSNVYMVDGHKVIQCNVRDITLRRRQELSISSQLEELIRWQDVMLNREDRVQQLKREVNELCKAVGKVARYPSQDSGFADAEAKRLTP